MGSLDFDIDGVVLGAGVGPWVGSEDRLLEGVLDGTGVGGLLGSAVGKGLMGLSLGDRVGLGVTA